MTTPPTATPRRRRWPWIGLAILVLLVVAAVVLLPLVLDVERHRGRIEAALGDSTGWDAQLGAIDVAVLRGAAVTVSPVRLDAPDTDSYFDAETIEIRAALLPLLRGRLEIRTVRLVRPRFELVRSGADDDWDLPVPDRSETEGTEAESSGLAVSVGEISVSGGTLRLVDRSTEPPRTTELVDLDLAFQPSTGDLRGETSVGDGKLSWTGRFPEVTLALERISTDPLMEMAGEGRIGPGGVASGSVQLSLPDRVEGTVTFENVKVLSGEEPFEKTTAEFSVGATEAGWELERLQLVAAGTTMTGSGRISPDVDLRIEIPSARLEDVLELTRRTVPLQFDVQPPGRVTLVADIDMPAGGELRYKASGTFAAARFVANELLPPVTDLETRFALAPDGSLVLDLSRAAVGGGALAGRVTIDSIDPPGSLVFDGRLNDAGLGHLLGGLVEGASERIAGPVGLTARMRVDLGAATLDASSLAGRLELEAGKVTLPGWELEGAIRSKITEKLGALAALAGGSARDEPPGGDLEKARIERLAAAMDFDDLPWRFDTLDLVAGNVEARGRGTFDPLAGQVDLTVSAKLSPALTARYVERHSMLRSLVAADGRLEVPLRIRGPMMRPTFQVEIGELSPLKGRNPKKAVEGLLDGLIDRERGRRD